MTYQTLQSLNTGQPIPSAQWNAMRDNQEWIAAPPMCTLTRTARWNVTGDRYGPFTAADIDTHGFWDPDTDATLATVPADAGGTYLITGWVALSPSRVAVGGGPISPGETAMLPQLITPGGTSSLSIESRSIDDPYSFTTTYPLQAGYSVALKINLTPVEQFGLTLHWMRP